MPDPLRLVAFDWSARGIHVTTDGEEVVRMAGIDELLESLDGPHVVVCESTLESWDPARRQAAISAFAAAGHILRVFRPTHTAKYRKRRGLDKTDTGDAAVIWQMAADGTLHLYTPKALDADWVARSASVNREYVLTRLTGGKDALFEKAQEILGPYKNTRTGQVSSLTDEAREVLGNGSAYSTTLLAAAYFAASRCSTRAEFDRLLGLYGNAHPSVLRSEVHHHSLRHARKRGVTMSQYRREARRLFAKFKAAGVGAPPR